MVCDFGFWLLVFFFLGVCQLLGEQNVFFLIFGKSQMGYSGFE